MIYVCSSKPLTDSLLEGKVTCLCMDELYKIVADPNTREIEFKEDFISQNFTTVELQVFIAEAKKMNPYLKFNIPSKFNKRHLDVIQKLQQTQTIPDIFDVLVRASDISVDTIHALAKVYLETNEEQLAVNNKLGTLRLQMLDLSNTLAKEQLVNIKQGKQLENVRGQLELLLSRLRINYGSDINEDVLNGIHIDICKYYKILYIKEITRVRYTDTLIYYLLEILKTLYSVKPRFIVMESPYAGEKYSLYPNMKNYASLTYKDVVQHDIFMCGFQYKLVENILKNGGEHSYLIVLDRTGGMKPFIRGTGVEYVYAVSSKEDLKEMEEPENILSYSKDGLYIPYISGFEKLSMAERISHYSSTKVIQKMVKLLERTENAYVKTET